MTGDGLDHVYGLTPVLNALQARRRPSFDELKVQDRSNSEGGGGGGGSNVASRDMAAITRLAEEMGVPVLTMNKHDMNMLSNNRPHQGVILTAGPVPLEHLDELASPPAATAPVWLALDEVVDPQNLGALLRSAAFLGASGVVICAKNSAALSPVVSKASAGALEVATNLHSTRNMPRFLSKCGERGWRVVGTTIGKGSIPLRDLEPASGWSSSSRSSRGGGGSNDGSRNDGGGIPTILVLGNEGHGLRTMVERSCDTLDNIEKHVRLYGDDDSGDTAGDGVPDADGEGAPSGRAAGGVDSLNVAVSGGIVLYHLLS